jgi:hypothetical protein
MSFQDKGLDTGLRQMQRGRQSGEAAAHDHDIGEMHALETRVFFLRRRGCCP